MFNRELDFLRTHIWRLRFEQMPTHRRWLLRPLRVLMLAVRGFGQNRIHVRAAALTYYTILSIVPTLAVALGIAKGFGIEEVLERVIRSAIRGQDDVVARIVEWARNLLVETRGGVVAGIGVVILFWTIVRLLSTIELSFNDIWGLPRGRPLGRRVVDYLAITLLAPILLTVSGTVAMNIDEVAARYSGTLVPITPGGALGLLLSFVAAAALFGFMYRFMPNTHVTFRAAALGGLVGGATFQLMQWTYVRALVALTQANAVYGTLSALPLFLIWLQLSWLLVLFGAEIAYAVDNEETYAAEQSFAHVSTHVQRVLALWLAEKIAKRFHAGAPPYTSAELSHEIGVPVRIVRKVLYDLVGAGVLTAFDPGRSGDAQFQPARSTTGLTVKVVLDALNHAGQEPTFEFRSEDLTGIVSRLEEFDRLVRGSPANALLHEI